MSGFLNVWKVNFCIVLFSDMIICRVFASLFLVLSCIAGVLLAQTFQYSRGWTNGKKRAFGMSTHDAACQLQRLKIIMEGKNIDQVSSYQQVYYLYRLDMFCDKQFSGRFWAVTRWDFVSYSFNVIHSLKHI